MHDFKPLHTPTNIMTGAGPLPVEGYGTCMVKDEHSNETFVLRNVMFVPSSPVNIYSTTQLNLEGGSFSTTPSCARLTDLSGRTLKSKKHYKGIYLFSAIYPEHTMFASMNDYDTWHKRLGHPSHDALKRMISLKCVDGLIIEDTSPPSECIGCITGKFKRSPFPRDLKPYNPLDLLHTDISGDYPAALNGHRFFTTLRDHSTGYTLVHTHAHKSEAAEFLKTSILKLERDTGLKVKAVRSDRGSEYTSTHMQEWFKAHNIDQQLTTVESSASNGVAERVNLTLMNRVRATLVESNQPRLLWPWALKHVAHALNFIPATTSSKTPHELLYGTPPDVSHLHAFGAAVAAWTPTQNRADKLVPRADLCRFVGYSNSTKIFQVR